jgi:hypothetical protein
MPRSEYSPIERHYVPYSMARVPNNSPPKRILRLRREVFTMLPDKTPEPASPPQDASQPPPPPPFSVPSSPPTQEEPPDLWKSFLRWIHRKFGLRGSIVVTVFAVLVPLVWSNRDTVKNFPVISFIVTKLSQAPLPKADPQRFAVALAHLEYDKDQQYERLIREVLRDFKGVQLLQFDRTISLDGTKPEEKAEKGHTQARQYLEDSGHTC